MKFKHISPYATPMSWLHGTLAGRRRGDIVLDVTLFGLKRGQAPPPTPEELTVPADAEVTEWPGNDLIGFCLVV